MPVMLAFSTFALAPALAIPAGAEQMADARLLVEMQVRAAAAACLVLEQEGISAVNRAALLLPLAQELESLHARRAQVEPSELQAEEARAAANAGVQQIALRLLRDMERCAAADYGGSPELKAAVVRLALAFEGETAASPEPPPTAQSGAE